MNEYKYKITVLTATYNRKNELNRLYQSLLNQTEKNFQWVIIDDGSSDETEKEYGILSDADFLVEYYKKKNGGKHTALNYSHPYIKGELVLMVDSDDYLEAQAIEVIIKDWTKFRNNKNICGLSYHRRNENGQYLCSLSPTDYYVDNEVHYRLNNRIKGERCEVIRTDLFIKYPFPEFENEKYMPESWLFITLAKKYNMVYINKALIICEYLDGGLTSQGRSLRLKNPLGMLEWCRCGLYSNASSNVKVKYTLLYWVYGKCAKYSVADIVNSSGQSAKMIILAPVGIGLYFFWKLKYL